MPISSPITTIHSRVPQNDAQLVFLVSFLASPRHALHSVLPTLRSPPLLHITPIAKNVTILLFSMRICLINPVSSPVMILMVEDVIQLRVFSVEC